VRTAERGYLRLRADHYDDAALVRWLDRARTLWPTVFVFFKHEQNAPILIERTAELLSGAAVEPPGAADLSPRRVRA
jgi:hypothetical protein